MAIKSNYSTRPGFSHDEDDGKYEMSLEEFKKWLKRFDKDKDGRISKEEFREAIRAGGVWFPGLRSRKGVRAADKNNNGFIDDNEINNLKDFALKYLGVRIVTSVYVSSDGKVEMSIKEFKKWLMKFDADKDGRINREELREAIRATATGINWFSTLKSKDGIKSADKNHDGFIQDDEIDNLKEFALKHLGIRIVTY